MTFKEIKLYAFKDNLKTITLNQYEHTVCKLGFELFCGDKPLDLTAFEEIRFYAQKPDGTIIGRTCTVEKTQAMLAVPLQLTTVTGLAKCTIECSSAEGNIRFGGFNIYIIPSQDNEKAIESSDEFTLLETTINEAKKIISEGVATDEQVANAVEDYFEENPLPLLTETDKSDIARMVIEGLGGNPVFGYVDENNNIIVSGKLADGTYSVKYEMEDGTTIDIGNLEFDSNVYYSVTNNLTNCTNSNSTTQAIEGNSYTATISANSGYELSSVTVTMGGTDITSTAVNGGNINITNVTGDIVITAVAEKAVVNYTNLFTPSEATLNQRVNSSNVLKETPGHFVTGFIDVSNKTPFTSTTKLYVKGANFNQTSSGNYYGKIMSYKTLPSSGYADNYSAIQGSEFTATDEGNGVISVSNDTLKTSFSSGVKYMVLILRIRDTDITEADIQDVVITIDEPIA